MSNLTTTTVTAVAPTVRYQDDNKLVSVQVGDVTIHTYVHVPTDGSEPYVVIEVNTDDDDGDPFKVYVNDGVVHDGTRVVWIDRSGESWERDPAWFDGRWVLTTTLAHVRQHGYGEHAGRFVSHGHGRHLRDLRVTSGPLTRA